MPNSVSRSEHPLPRKVEMISGCHVHFSVANSQVILVPFLARISLGIYGNILSVLAPEERKKGEGAFKVLDFTSFVLVFPRGCGHRVRFYYLRPVSTNLKAYGDTRGAKMGNP